MKKSTVIKLICLTLLTLLAAMFSGSCSPKTESDTGLSSTSAPDLSNHPVYSNYDFSWKSDRIEKNG